MVTIDNSAITYYIDGQLFGTHGAAYLPERGMSINFNQWLIDLAGQTSTTPRAYDQQVDYVLHVKDHVLTASAGEREGGRVPRGGDDVPGHGSGRVIR